MSDQDKNSTNGSNGAQSFGAWLKQERSERGISLEEIAAVTKIHIVQLQHLEDNELGELPSMAFVRGFLVNYARHVGLDEDEVLEKFKQFAKVSGSLSQFVKKKAAQNNPAPVKMVQTPKTMKAPGKRSNSAIPKNLPLKKKHLVAIGLVILLIATLSLLVSLGKKSSPVETAQNSPAQANEPQPLQEPSQLPAEAQSETEENVDEPPPEPKPEPKKPEKKVAEKKPEPKPQPKPVEKKKPVVAESATLEVKSLESTWIKVRVDRQNPEGLQLDNGKSARYSVKEKVVLSLSNAGAVEIRWNNQWYQPPGFRGDIKSITLPDQIASLKKK